jgi:hypothetical protein
MLNAEEVILVTPEMAVGSVARMFWVGAGWDIQFYLRRGDGLTGDVVGYSAGGAYGFAIDNSPVSQYTLTATMYDRIPVEGTTILSALTGDQIY